MNLRNIFNFGKIPPSITGILLLVTLLYSCTKPKIFDNETYTFPGIERVQVEKDGSIVLAWEKIPVDAPTYFIYRRTKNEVFDWNKPIESSITNSWRQAPYSLDTQYCFAVRFSKISIEDDTNTKELCPDLTYIKSFDGIKSASVVSQGAVTVTWDTPSLEGEISGYNIYSNSEFSTVIDTAPAGTNEKTISGLAADSIATLGVRAVDKYGRTDSNTKTISISVVNNAALAFKGLETAVQASTSTVKLTWLSPPGSVKEYRLYKATGSYGSSPTLSYAAPFKTISSSLLESTVSDLGDELTHCFVLRSVSSGGQEDPNIETKCVSFADSGAPVFSGISSAAFTAGGAQISWTASNSQVSSYYVYYQMGSGPINFSTATSQVVANLPPPAEQQTTATILGLQDNTTYTFAVRAKDARSISDTNTASRTITSNDLTPPVFLGITSLVADHDTQLTVTFNRSTESDVNLYSLRVRETSVGGAYTQKATVVQTSSGATLTGTISGLLPATSYDVLIKAIDTSSNASTNTLATTRATLDLTPPVFSGISAVSLDPTDQSKVKVSWNAATDSSGVLGYRVYYSTATMSACAASLKSSFVHPRSYSGCGANVNMSTLVTSATSFSFAGLTEGSTYYFIVHALDNSNVNNEDANTVQSAFNVPYYTPPAVPTSVAIVGGNGPSANSAITVTGTGGNGNTIKIYVNGVFSTQQVINSGTSFSIPVSLSTVAGTYAVSASQVNLSSVEGPQAAALNYVLQNLAPTAALSGTPCTPTVCYTNTSSLNITVAGTNVTTYQYAILYNQSTACSSASYSAWTAVATLITNDLTVTGDGSYKLCVLGKDAAGNTQSAASATQFEFTRDTAAPTAPTSLTLTNPITNSTSVTFSPLVSATVAAVTGATKYCVTPTNVAPASNAACWTTSTTTTVTLTSNNAYAWAMKVSGMVSLTSATASITYTNICDSGDLATSCTISSSKTLINNQWIGGQGNLTVTSTGSLTGNSTELSTISLLGNFILASAGQINANITLNAVNIDVQGTISSNGKGTQGTTASAGSPGSSGGALESVALCNTGSIASAGGGGGHAGAGGAGYNSGGSPVPAIGGIINASLNAAQPVTFGGSGGASIAVASGYISSTGGAGGGAIKLNATDLLTINGTVSSNGSAGTKDSTAHCYGGGGAGGSVWLIANSIAGTGSIAAKGGTAALHGTNTRPFGGPGGGGAISITSSNAFKGSVNVDSGAASTYLGGTGSAGRVTVAYSNPCDTGDLNTNCTITGPIVWGTSQSFSGSGNLIIAANGSLLSPAKMQSISIAMGGNITVQDQGSIFANLSNVTGNHFTIDLGGVVAADGLGYWASTSSANAISNSYGKNGGTSGPGTGGGGYGGRGGAGVGALIGAGTMAYTSGTKSTGGASFGSPTQPVGFGGSGGANEGTSICSSGNNGPPGGGAIKISVTGILTVNGTLSANGQTGCGGSGASVSTGGGAGGSIWLNVSTLAGSGTVTANGGAGGQTTSTTTASGGGSGGRIAAYNTNKFSGQIFASGGLASNVQSFAGEPGTVYFANQDNYCSGSGTLSTTCTISQTWGIANGWIISGSGNLVIANGGMFYGYRTESSSIAMVSGTVTIQSGGTIKGNFEVSANNISINSGGTIDAIGWGYQPVESGTGNGYQTSSGGTGSASAACGGGGGAHGNNGGNANQMGIGGTSYGSASAPILMGSAAGSCYTGMLGGAGGGAIRLIATSTTTIDGNLTVNGLAGPASGNGSSGAGAGGSIYITTSTFAGAATGTLTANGGAGGTGAVYYSGGGSGGRISVVKSSTTFSGSQSAAGGASGGGTATAGGAGTVQ